MALRTVRVPSGMEPLFERAEEIVSAYFAERRDEPREGTIEIQGERYVLVRAASLSVEFFTAVRDLLGSERTGEADEFARNVLFDLAHAIGKADATRFHEKMGLDDPISKLSAGPVHFAHAGWAFVDISAESQPSEGDDYFLLYDHPYSFESDAWVRSGAQSEFPACVMNSGYSSGWCEASFGMELVATEILCRARGDDRCRFVMAPPSRIEERVREYLESVPELAAHAGGYRIPDLFARKRLEDELRAARDELEIRVEERTEELRLANERLETEIAERAAVEKHLLQSQKLESLGRLAGGIAHDFNNLLMAIGGCSELMLEDLAPNDPVAELAAEIAHATERAARLTGQLLLFSRHEGSSTEVVDLGESILGMSEMLQRLLGESIELACSATPGGNCIRLDPSRIEQVVLNLALNARDAMPRGGRLLVRVDRVDSEEAGPRVRLTVCDDGEGMDEETLNRLFDPFYTTKSPGQGTGLGLSTVHGIVQQAGGDISVESRPGKGSDFRVFLPLVDEEPTRSTRAAEPAGDAEACVLLVEDEDSVRRLMELVLQRRGCRVLVAATPAEATTVFEARADEIDLLLTDVLLPGIDGSELAMRLRESRPDLRVLFVSGYAGDGVVPEGLGREGDAFLQKPFTLGRLAETIQGLLRD